MSYHRHQKIHRRDFIRAAIVLALVVLVLACGAYGLKRWEDARYAVPESDGKASDGVLSTTELKQITYQGETYQQRSGLETYLFMGIDETGEAVGTEGYIAGGQADAQMVLVIDNANETYQILQLNRDSMVEIPVLGMTGTVVGTTFAQLALAHAFGNGREESCENNVNTVSALLDDQTIDGYIAVNMDAVEIVTDLVGGVTLTITSDFSAIDSSLVLGETMTLTGEQALTYVRNRKDVDDQTNLARMARQRQYLTALQEKLELQDAGFALTVYDALTDYMITDIPSGTAYEIAQKMQQYTQLDLLTIDGENQVEDDSWAYYLDEDSLQQTILQLFYEKI